MSTLMVRPSSHITSCTCSAISGGKEEVIVLAFLLKSLLGICCLTLYNAPSGISLSSKPLAAQVDTHS